MRAAIMIKAALFDVFGTCVDWRSGVTDFVRPFLLDRGLNSNLAEQIADDWRKLYDPSMERVRSGERPYVKLNIIQRENLDTVLDGIGIAPRFDDHARNQLNLAWEHLPAWSDTNDALMQLKNLMPIAACSNGSQSMMERLAAYADLPWSMICGADTGQNFKPHPDVYLKSCQALRTEPAETVMVACHADDLDAAAALGLRTAYFPRPREWGSVDFEPEPRSGRFDFTSATFSTLITDIVKHR
ncbi:MAG: haloacid dehalogenase type II [Pseudomonadota bacterium]